VLHLMMLVAVYAAIGLVLMTGVMYFAAGWRWDDLRDSLLHHAYKSFIHEGEKLQGVNPGLLARLTIRAAIGCGRSACSQLAGRRPTPGAQRDTGPRLDPSLGVSFMPEGGTQIEKGGLRLAVRVPTFADPPRL